MRSRRFNPQILPPMARTCQSTQAWQILMTSFNLSELARPSSKTKHLKRSLVEAVSSRVPTRTGLHLTEWRPLKACTSIFSRWPKIIYRRPSLLSGSKSKRLKLQLRPALCSQLKRKIFLRKKFYRSWKKPAVVNKKTIFQSSGTMLRRAAQGCPAASSSMEH